MSASMDPSAVWLRTNAVDCQATTKEYDGMGRLPKSTWLLTLSILMLHVGCKGSPTSLHRWGGGPYGQGSVDRQKSRAVTFDPYPLNDIGPPVVGGRPREYANPLPEAARNELTARPIRGR